jgi:hypothetical protein
MDDYEFEKFVADLWSRMDWDTEVTQASADAGIDVVAEKDSPYQQKKVIQAKRYSDSTTVGSKEIQRYNSLRHQVDGADSVVVVTTSRFTGPAEARASDLNVKLADGERLVVMIDDLNAGDLVIEYLSLSGRSPTTASESRYVEETTNSNELTDADVGTPLDNSISLCDWDRWHWVAAGSGVLALSAMSVSPGAFGVLLLLTGVALYIDALHIRRVSAWSPRVWLYLLGLLAVLLSLPIYLINRYRYVSAE